MTFYYTLKYGENWRISGGVGDAGANNAGDKKENNQELIRVDREQENNGMDLRIDVFAGDLFS